MARLSQCTPFGFALPTVLVASVVLLMILVTAASTTIAIANGLREQGYLRQANLAAEAGNAHATACLGLSNGTVTWSDEKPLRPNTDCSGNVEPVRSAYVLNSAEEGFRSYFVVDQSREAKGYVEALRASNGIAWRIWSSTASAAQGPGGSANPVGTYIEGAWTTAPAGYLLADGSAVSRTTYASLFAVIGTTYGVGNGSTTFNLPDARGRVLVQGSTDTEFDTLGEKGGAKTHTLTTAQMPSHTHTQTAHTHGPGALSYFSVFGTSVSRQTLVSGGSWWVTTSTTLNDIGSVAVTGSTTAVNQNTGGGGAHNNLQPYIAVNRAIKY